MVVGVVRRRHVVRCTSAEMMEVYSCRYGGLGIYIYIYHFFLEAAFEVDDLPDGLVGRGFVSFRGGDFFSMPRPWFMASKALHAFRYVRLAERYFLMYK